MNYCGIDLHSNNSLVVVIDDHDKVLQEKRIPNNLAEILTLLSPYQRELASVIIEATYKLVLAGRRADGKGLRGQAGEPVGY